MTARQRRVARRSRKKRGPIFLGLGLLVATLAIGALSAVVWVLNVAADAPPLEELKPIDKGANSTVFAADGTRLGVISSDTIRQEAKLDRSRGRPRGDDRDRGRRLLQHGGVDLGAIVRAAVENAEAGEVVQGGSTITQQLIKNLYTGQIDDRDLKDKIQEAKLAEELEQRFSKDEILGQVPEHRLLRDQQRPHRGRHRGGRPAVLRQAGAAAQRQAGGAARRPAAGPFPAQPAAQSEGGDQAPQRGARARWPSRATSAARRANRLFTTGLGVDPTRRFDRVKEQYFFDYVTEQLIATYGANTVRAGGLEVHTTIDLDKQRAARAAIDRNLAGVGPSAAIVTTEADSGNVLAMVSNADYEDRKFNLAAQGQRQPGSAFKTMVLTAAAARGRRSRPDLLHVEEPARDREPAGRPLGGQHLLEQLRRPDEPAQGDDDLRQHRLRPARSRRRSRVGPPDRLRHGDHQRTQRLPGGGHRRTRDRGHAARDVERLRDARRRRRPPRAELDQQGRLPRRRDRHPRARRVASGRSATEWPTR